MAPFRAVLFAAFLSACPYNLNAQTAGPTNAREGACYIQYSAPALIETVTQQVLVRPEKRGIDPATGQSIVTQPAIYRTETVQKIVRDRKDGWTEVICAKDQGFVFIQTLQRALAARKLYSGAITGIMDEPTKRALRKVQKAKGLNTTEVTLDLAESYGLVTHRLFAQ